MTYLLNSIYAIEVPEDASNISISIIGNTSLLQYWVVTETGTSMSQKSIPGSYEILFTTKGCSEEQASGVIEKGKNDRYRFYNKRLGVVYNLESSVASLYSLLRSRGLKPELNYLLVKKKV